jgi:hypothetical protein
MTDFGELAEPVGFSEDAGNYALRGSRASTLNVELDAVDVSERFKREAHLHTIITPDLLLILATS